MFEDEILKPGEKIKKLRVELNMNQSEIAGDFDRSNISSAERTGNISKILAETIVQSFNKKIGENKLNLEKITSKWLLENIDIQIERFIDKYLDKLSDAKMSQNQPESTDFVVELINSFIKKYSIRKETKVKIFNTISDTYFSIACYEKCKIYALREYTLAVRYSDGESVLKAIVNYIRASYYSNNYKELINFIEIAEETAEDYKIKQTSSLKIIYYYAVKVYSKIDKLDVCLQYIKLLEENFKLIPNEYFDVLTMKGVCYLRNKDLTECKLIFEDILKRSKEQGNANIAALTYVNLAEIELEENKIKECDKYIIKALDIKTDKSYHTNVMYYSLLTSIKSNNMEFIKNNYLETLNCLLEIKEVNMQYDIIVGVFNYYVSNLIDDSLEELLKVIYDKILSNHISDIRIGYLFNIAKDYFTTVDVEIAEKYFKIGLKAQYILLKKDLAQN